LTLAAREKALEQVLEIQRDVNTQAILQHRPLIELINGIEEARIRELISMRTYPQRWSDEDPDATVLIPQTYRDGNIQDILPMVVFEDDFPRI
jgi:DNA sulfur modification protein DndC